MRSFFTLLIKHSCDQVKKNEIGRAGSMHERERERERRDVHIGVWLCNLSERDHLNTGVDGRIILKRILK